MEISKALTTGHFYITKHSASAKMFLKRTFSAAQTSLARYPRKTLKQFDVFSNFLSGSICKNYEKKYGQ